MQTEIQNKYQDIYDLGLDAQTTARYIQLRKLGKSLVSAATETPEGIWNLGLVMGFLNHEIESARPDFHKN